MASSGHFTASMVISNINTTLLGTQQTISGMYSYTTYLSDTIAIISVASSTLSFSTAPTWYAPALPRPVADVGWRFEEMGGDVRQRYSVVDWGVWIAQLLAAPLQLVKGLAPLAALLGPFGLLLVWMLIMVPIVLVFRILQFLKNNLVQIFHFIWDLIKFIISFIPGVG
jgi:hypothetical protein